MSGLRTSLPCPPPRARRFLCRIGLHRWTHQGWTLIDGLVCVDCGKETWDW